MINTKFDYEYLKANSTEEFKREARNLLEGRFAVINDELVEDQNAPLFRLGLTVTQVEADCGWSGKTQREIDWYESQPDCYQCVNGEYIEIVGAKDAKLAVKKLELLEAKLSEVDAALSELQNGTFEYNGHNYYIDPVTITGQVVGLSMLPDTYTRTWKTADKDVDGVTNIEVTLNKQQLSEMAIACMLAWGSNWDKADAAKRQLKALYKSGGDVESFVVKLK